MHADGGKHYDHDMLSISKQVVLCALVAITMVLVVSCVLKQNVVKNDNTSHVHTYPLSQLYEVNLIVFFATLFSTSRSSILFITDKVLGRQIAPSSLGLINVLIKTVCIVLFDFRIIHVGKTNQDTRMMILYADIASNLFNEACQLYPHIDEKVCCHCHHNLEKEHV